MLGIKLEFAANTAEDNQKVIKGACDPQALVSAYRQACEKHQTHDIVVICPDFKQPDVLLGWARKDIRAKFKDLPPGIFFGEAAHKVVQAPVDVDAFWVCVMVPGSAIPATAVVLTIPYEQELVGAPN